MLPQVSSMRAFQVNNPPGLYVRIYVFICVNICITECVHTHTVLKNMFPQVSSMRFHFK
jgi:hypothetical protein